ncbi:MAG: hypothetical protein ACM3TR_18665 [Caulobacteraceae bacterium]
MSRKIAFGGVFAGLTVVLVYMAFIMPTGKLTLYFLSSLPIAFSVVEFGAGVGAVVYFGAGILSFLITGNIYAAVPFILFFGHYPILKCFIEKNRKALTEVLLKLAVFNASAAVIFLLIGKLLWNTIPDVILNYKILLVVLVILAQGAFLAYDYVFSRLIFYYESKMSLFRRG